MNNQDASSRLENESDFRISYTVDSFGNGIAFGKHKHRIDDDPREHYYLRLEDKSELVKLKSRYSIENSKPLSELESHLKSLSKQGVLAQAVIHLGTSTDPFIPFEGKFDVSIKFLELFKKYTPGLLVVQTRSPLIVVAMPVLTALGNRCSVTIGVETHKDEIRQKYTPHLPRIEERIKTARALRRFGIEVQLHATPILPYGDWKKEAVDFAEFLAENSDFVFVKGFNLDNNISKKSRIARRLAAERKFHWLRKDAATPVLNALEKIAPEKLIQPAREQLRDKQLDMFAA
ncbi:MAG: hypothetical protein R3A13_10930 [Bdellovibrionota bacterium]